MKTRIDKEVLIRGLVPSRSKAKELIEMGCVKCNNEIIKKCNYLVDDNDKLEIINKDRLKYVSRGGLKLEKAINEFKIDFHNLKVMDIGSSTGGFCDCALQNGATSIVAIDVGTDLLHPSLKCNTKIKLFEKTNFKDVAHELFKGIDIITCDVSFISLKKIIDKIHNENIKIDLICLIKPQFECGKEIANKYKGIILNKKIHLKIINELIGYFNSLKFYVKNITYSPIKGGDGNIEYLIYISNKITANNIFDVYNIINEAFKEK